MRRAFAICFQIVGVVTVTFALACAVAAYALPGWLQFEDRLEKSDYIVPLAGDLERVVRAAELYRQGLAPRILLSQAERREPARIQLLARDLGYRLPEAQKFRTELLAHFGVPDNATQSFGGGHVSTVEEAEALRARLGGAPVRLILVTAPYHARRSKIIFSDVLPNADIRVANSGEKRLTRNWWKDQYSAQVTVSESVKLLFYLAGGGFRAARPKPD
ncbi:MAG: YdcF family protein [Pseudomonadota bacterium]|nr:YdcF family protein [Pseudomonadota bacterium]